MTALVERINSVVWGVPTLLLFIGCGVFFSIRLRLPQLTRGGEMLRTVFQRQKTRTDKTAVSPFQSMCTALAASIGTGNIVGVCAAVAAGGPGAVFWMLVSALLGEATSYAENALGVVCREQTETGEYLGGAMYTIRTALSSVFSKKTAGRVGVLYALLSIGAALGMGNAVQVNAASLSLRDAFSVPLWLTGAVAALAVGLLLLRGRAAVARVTEKLVPFACILFLLVTILVLVTEYRRLPSVCLDILRGAFGIHSAGAGFSAAMLRNAVIQGMRRGVFSNEAGLGTAVVVHAAAVGVTPREQGMRGMAEVFFDTVVMCTLTAFCVLLVPGSLACPPEAMLSFAFSAHFGVSAEKMVAVAVTLFAFSTLIGWSFYGLCAARYAGGRRAELPFTLLYTAAAFLGAVSSFGAVWELSDLMNGLLAFPNLLSLFLLADKAKQTLYEREPLRRGSE